MLCWHCGTHGSGGDATRAVWPARVQLQHCCAAGGHRLLPGRHGLPGPGSSDCPGFRWRCTCTYTAVSAPLLGRRLTALHLCPPACSPAALWHPALRTAHCVSQHKVSAPPPSLADLQDYRHRLQHAVKEEEERLDHEVGKGGEGRGREGAKVLCSLVVGGWVGLMQGRRRG